MAGGALTQLRMDIGGLFHRTSTSGSSLPSGASGGSATGDSGLRGKVGGTAGNATQRSTGTAKGTAAGGTPGASSGTSAANAGRTANDGNTSAGTGDATGQTSVSSLSTAGTGASAPVTTNNAPPPTPTVLDGVKITYNPFKPSDGPYPTLTGSDHVWIDVSIDQQLVYIMNGNKVLYIMATSTGLDTKPDNSTPLGVYHIQLQRGTWFYSSQYQMGAKYWVSWLGHGIFLFHSVPMNENGQVLPNIAAKLGRQPASEGCFHLTIPDAKWVYDNIPHGTTVVVEQAPVALQSGTIYHPSLMQQAAEQASASSSGAGASSGTSAS